MTATALSGVAEILPDPPASDHAILIGMQESNPG
jgi:hypothetical protein